MNFTYVDTDSLDEISSSIIELVGDYDIEINNLFKRFSNVPYETREWVGQSAEYYFKTVALDKTTFIDFGNSIREFAYKIANDSEKLRNTINNCVDNESRKELL